MTDTDFDCLIIGGGPAGLTAAIYLARFHLKLKVVDAGQSRAGLIPCTHNHAGFPDGISGEDLVARMREQAQKYGASIENGRVMRLAKEGDLFEAHWGGGTVSARTVLLATGVSNRKPPMDEALHDDALKRGLIRYCPICDGYEVTDKNIAVIGDDSYGVKEAVFLRGFTDRITFIAPDTAHSLRKKDAQQLHDLGIEAVDGPCHAVGIDGDCITIDTAEGKMRFDSVYPALGSDVHSDLAKSVGASVSDSDCILIDSHQRTDVTGLYAAGDVVIGLDQISHAMGHGGVAATTIRNDLADIRPLIRSSQTSLG